MALLSAAAVRLFAGSGLTNLGTLGGSATANGSIPIVSATGAGGAVAWLPDGATGFLSIAATISSSSHTLACWMYHPTALNHLAGVYISKRGAGGNQFQMWRRPVAVGTLLYYWNGIATTDSNTAVPFDAWTLLGVCRSGTTVKFWQDGVLVRTVTSSVPVSSTELLRIGTDNVGNYSAGTIDDIVILNDVLDDAVWPAWFAAGRGYLLPDSHTSNRRRQSSQSFIRGTF